MSKINTEYTIKYLPDKEGILVYKVVGLLPIDTILDSIADEKDKEELDYISDAAQYKKYGIIREEENNDK